MIPTFRPSITQIFTAKEPLPQIKTLSQLLVKMNEGQRDNSHPVAIPSVLWPILDDCFSDRPEDRPSAEMLLNFIDVVEKSVNGL
jgi:hypothetical protein